MEVQELHDILREDIVGVRGECEKIRDELHALNGQVRTNKMSIKAIWAIFGAAYTIAALWLRNHL